MEILGFFSGMSLVEWLIVSFIGANMTLSGAYLIQVGLTRRSAVASDE